MSTSHATTPQTNSHRGHLALRFGGHDQWGAPITGAPPQRRSCDVYAETVFTCPACDVTQAVWAVVIKGRQTMWCAHQVTTHRGTLTTDGALFYRVQSC